MTTRDVPLSMSFGGLRIGDIARNSASNFTLELAQQVKAHIAQWRHRARSRRDLMELDGRELWDLHLTRCDAMNEAGKPFWKE